MDNSSLFSTTPAPTAVPMTADSLTIQAMTADIVRKMQKYDSAFDAYRTCSAQANCLSTNVSNVSSAYSDLNDALNKLTNYLTQNGATSDNITEDILVLYYQVIIPLRDKIDRDEKEIRQMQGLPKTGFAEPESKIDVAQRQYDGSIMLRYGFSMVAAGLLFLLFQRMRNSGSA